MSNGNYVVTSSSCDSATAIDVGAVTWGNGTTGITGTVTASNSLVGTTGNDHIGDLGVTVLSNGNYVVRSPYWSNVATATSVGAVTWGNGTTGSSGAINAANSLVGTTSNRRHRCRWRHCAVERELRRHQPILGSC